MTPGRPCVVRALIMLPATPASPPVCHTERGPVDGRKGPAEGGPLRWAELPSPGFPPSPGSAVAHPCCQAFLFCDRDVQGLLFPTAV